MDLTVEERDDCAAVIQLTGRLDLLAAPAIFPWPYSGHE